MAEQENEQEQQESQQSPDKSARERPRAAASGESGTRRSRPSGGPRRGAGRGRGRREGRRGGGRFRGRRRRRCLFCEDKSVQIDYKQASVLRPFLTDRGKIRPRRQTGTCARHQRQLSVAIKRARHLALLPFVVKSGRPGS